MPELPEVEMFRRYIDRSGLHRRIESVDIFEARVLVTPAGELAARLRGSGFQSSRRRGKHLFLATDVADTWLYLHFGMTGRPAFVSPGEDMPRYTRVRFGFEDGGTLAFVDPRQFGKVGLVRDPEEFAVERRLGPDPMEPGTAPSGIRKALAGRSGGLKAVLLDQRVLAGIGNLYADEILYRARQHPLTPVSHLDADTMDRLARAILDVLHAAVDREAAYGEYPEDWMIHRRREGAPCPCGGSVERIRAAGRTTYFCPSCQERR